MKMNLYQIGKDPTIYWVLARSKAEALGQLILFWRDDCQFGREILQDLLVDAKNMRLLSKIEASHIPWEKGNFPKSTLWEMAESLSSSANGNLSPDEAILNSTDW